MLLQLRQPVVLEHLYDSKENKNRMQKILDKTPDMESTLLETCSKIFAEQNNYR